MQSKGLKLVQESENPDLIVVGSGGMKTQTSYQAWGMRGIGGGMGGITPEQNLTGTLIVDIYDVKAKAIGLARRRSRHLERKELAEKYAAGGQSGRQDVQEISVVALR